MMGGKRVRQLIDGTFKVDMSEYANDLTPIKLTQAMRTKDGKPRTLTEDEVRLGKGVSALSGKPHYR